MNLQERNYEYERLFNEMNGTEIPATPHRAQHRQIHSAIPVQQPRYVPPQTMQSMPPLHQQHHQYESRNPLQQREVESTKVQPTIGNRDMNMNMHQSHYPNTHMTTLSHPASTSPHHQMDRNGSPRNQIQGRGSPHHHVEKSGNFDHIIEGSGSFHPQLDDYDNFHNIIQKSGSSPHQLQKSRSVRHQRRSWSPQHYRSWRSSRSSSPPSPRHHRNWRSFRSRSPPARISSERAFRTSSRNIRRSNYGNDDSRDKRRSRSRSKSRHNERRNRRRGRNGKSSNDAKSHDVCTECIEICLDGTPCFNTLSSPTNDRKQKKKEKTQRKQLEQQDITFQSWILMSGAACLIFRCCICGY